MQVTYQCITFYNMRKVRIDSLSKAQYDPPASALEFWRQAQDKRKKEILESGKKLKGLPGNPYNQKEADAIAKEQEALRQRAYYKQFSERPQAIQSTLGPVEGAIALAAGAPALASTLGTELLGTGVTLGNLANTGFATHGVYNFANPESDFRQALSRYNQGEGDWRDVAFEGGLNALNFLGAGSLPTDFKNVVNSTTKVGRDLAKVKRAGLREGLTDFEIARNQLRDVGITSNQRTAYIPGISELATKYVTPIGYYGGDKSKFKETLYNILEGGWEKKLRALGQYEDDVINMRRDAWNTYAGIPQKHGTFRMADTAPVMHPSYPPGSLTGMDIYSIPEQKVFTGSGFWQTSAGPGKNISSVFNPLDRPIILDRDMNLMGGYNKVLSKQGLQYNDIWNLEPELKFRTLLPDFIYRKLPSKIADKLFYKPIGDFSHEPRKITIPVDKFFGKPFMVHGNLDYNSFDYVNDVRSLLKDRISGFAPEGSEAMLKSGLYSDFTIEKVKELENLLQKIDSGEYPKYKKGGSLPKAQFGYETFLDKEKNGPWEQNDPYLHNFSTVDVPENLSELPSYRAYTFAKGDLHPMTAFGHATSYDSGYTKFDDKTGYLYQPNTENLQDFQSLPMEGDREFNLRRFVLNPYEGQQQTHDVYTRRDASGNIINDKENFIPKSYSKEETMDNVFKDLYGQNLYKFKGDRDAAYNATKEFMKNRVEPQYKGKYYEFMNNPDISLRDKRNISSNSKMTVYDDSAKDQLYQSFVDELYNPPFNPIASPSVKEALSPDPSKISKAVYENPKFKEKLDLYNDVLQDWYITNKHMTPEQAKSQVEGNLYKDTPWDKQKNNSKGKMVNGGDISIPDLRRVKIKSLPKNWKSQ